MNDQLQNYFSLVIAELGKLVQSLHSLKAASESESSTLITRLLEEYYRSLCEEIAQINLRMSNLNHFVTSLKHRHSALSLTEPRQPSQEDLAYWTNGLTERRQQIGEQTNSSSSTALPSFLTRPTTGQEG